MGGCSIRWQAGGVVVLVWCLAVSSLALAGRVAAAGAAPSPSLRGPNVAIGSQLRRITPFAIAGQTESVSTGTVAATVRWRSDGGQTQVSYPAGCVPRSTVLNGRATTALAGDDYVAAVAPAGSDVTLRVSCS